MDALAQMAHDATGRPAAGDGTTNDNASKDKSKKESAHVTRTIKGQKEIVIDIAALKGKGYPAPVNLDTGSGAQPQPTPAKRKSSHE